MFCGDDAIFEQDGAPFHATRTTRALLGEMFRRGVARTLAQENPTDAATLRAAIIRTEVRW